MLRARYAPHNVFGSDFDSIEALRIQHPGFGRDDMKITTTTITLRRYNTLSTRIEQWIIEIRVVEAVPLAQHTTSRKAPYFVYRRVFDLTSICTSVMEALCVY